MIYPGEEIPVDAKVREGLGREISEYIDDLENSYRQYFQDISTWWKWYEAEPIVKGQKNFPFLGASNLVVPLIRIMADANVNRMYAAIFRSATDIWALRTEREDHVREVRNLSRFLNWAAAGNDFNFRLPAYDNLLESAVIGESVLALNWREDVRWAYAPARTARTNGKVQLKAVQTRYGRGPQIEHVPREQILWDTNYPVGEAPFVCREFNWTWSKLRDLSELDSSWNAEVIEGIRGHGKPRGPSQQVKHDKEQSAGKMESFFGIADEHDIREVHMDWPVLRSMGLELDRVVKPGKEGMNVPSPPLVATLDRNTRKIVRLIAEPYYFPRKPFYGIQYRKRAGSGSSPGMGKLLEQMQRGMTASFNQSFDARTRANAVWAKTSMKDMLHKPLNPAMPIFDKDMKSFEPFALHPSSFDDQRMMTMVNTIAERLTGQSDPAMGRDTRQGGHPSPARSTMALLQQSDLLQGTGKELLRLEYSQIGEGCLSLYQQFEANEDGRLQRILGDSDAKLVESFLFPEDPISTVYEFDVMALSNNNNPADEMQRAMVVSQLNQQYWISVIKGLEIATNPQVNPLIRNATIKAIEAGTEAQSRFLEAGDIDDLERYVLAPLKDPGSSQQELDSAAGGAQEIAGGGAPPPNGGMGGGGGADAFGAAGAPRIGGGLG